MLGVLIIIFLSLFWSAYVPVVVLMMAAVGEWTADPRGTPVPHTSPGKRGHACACAVVPFPTGLKSLGISAATPRLWRRQRDA
jgi:hypothetical protein